MSAATFQRIREKLDRLRRLDPVGVWPLADGGCGMTEVLVVTGKQRGFVWTHEGGVWRRGRRHRTRPFSHLPLQDLS